MRLNGGSDHPSGFCPYFDDGSTGTYRGRHARAPSGKDSYGITRDDNTLTFGRTAAPDGGQFFHPNGIFLGATDATCRYMTNGTSLPSTTGRAVGEIVWNREPAAGEPLGWICVAQGTPDTWLPFGAIRSANAYATSNVTTDRTFDANATTTDELADVLGTLIADLKAAGVLA